MDFFRIAVKEPTKEGKPVEVRPDFVVGRSKDLMVRGQSFYAIWDEERNLWSTDEYDVQRLVDAEIDKYVEKLEADGVPCIAKHLASFGTNGWSQFRKFLKNVSDNSHQLDTKLAFANTEVKKTDYISRRLPYSMTPGDHSAWDELVGTLYSEEERAKIEWAIGAIISGDSKKIQKFLVFYGSHGTGKSTIMDIVSKLFGGLTSKGGYVANFEAKALVTHGSTFAMEAFKGNPLVAIQQDGDLSRIEDNSTLNSIVSHEDMRINEKFKPTYDASISAFLMMGTNKPVRITDAKSGLIRRLIDVKPTGDRLEPDHYFALLARIEFELGAIAQHCLDVYRRMGKNYYSSYRPVEMMFQTDVFFNFIEAHYETFEEQNSTTLKQAFTLYKEYIKESELEYKLPQHKFREELKNYFEEFHDRIMVDGTHMRSFYRGFAARQFKTPVGQSMTAFSLTMEEVVSLLDEELAGLPAQYSKTNALGKELPAKYWTREPRMVDGKMWTPPSGRVCDTILSDLNTARLHFVKVPKNHIVIDFDLTDDNGEKSLERNLVEASNWPPTYAEVSKSGSGVHLHYNYDGDVEELAKEYAPGIEVKTLLGDASLRRKLTKCNNIPVATISSGLPFKEKKVLPKNTLQSEKGLRDLIMRNLRKEIHPGTKPSIDFIHKILEDAYNSGMVYDVTDMRSRIMAFANNSSNQALACLKMVQRMQFKSEATAEDLPKVEAKDERLVIFDVEVFQNLFVVCWKYQGSDTIVRMINPTPAEVEGLFRFKLVGFNNRKYDNHIMWARMMGYDNAALFDLSQRIVNNDRNAMFGEAYSLSYADIYDFSSKKQSLKKWEIELGIHHMELDIPWDKPVPEELWEKVVEYCCNDVDATEAVFDHCKQDFVARQILADLSGLSVNDTTRKHSERIIFGSDRNPQSKFVYTDLSKEFPGYKFDEFNKLEKSTYRGEVTGEGGYVYAEPGMYENVALLDIASMHPTSIEQLNLFGPYTENFSAIKEARLAIKHGEFEKARKMLGGGLAPHVEEIEHIDDPVMQKKVSKTLEQALKLVINSIYGYTSATFDNPFRDPRNKDNIVAKRGALFMIELKHFVQDLGYKVVHIKTDSIKIPNADAAIIQEVTEFGKRYGYDFEHEDTYKKFCLVNDAVYIAKDGGKWTAVDHTEDPDAKSVFIDGRWHATGAQFQHPYVFKTLFSGESLNFADLCETKAVSKGRMYLRFEDVDHHVGRTGLFVPIDSKVLGVVGAQLLRIHEDKEYAVAGTKGYLWLEADMIQQLNGDTLERMPFEGINDAADGTGSIADIVDMRYFERLAEEAKNTINKFGDFEEFVK